MVDYHIDLENRIQLQEDIISRQNEQIKQLETSLEECSFVYKVDWENDEYQTFNYSVSRTFEGACCSLLFGIKKYKDEIALKHVYSNDFTTALSCWTIQKTILMDHQYFDESETCYAHDNIMYVGKTGRVNDYRDPRYYKIYCKVRKKLKGKI